MQTKTVGDIRIQEQVEDALKPFIHVLSPEDIEFMRMQLLWLIHEDESSASLLQKAYPNEADQSGEVWHDNIQSRKHG